MQSGSSADAAREAPGASPAPPAEKRISVVVIDDAPLVREWIGGLVRADDRLELVGEAAEGREGLELTRRLEPDVVVLDVFMPGMEGDEFLRRLRADRQLRAKVKVILLTAGPNPDLHDAIMQLPNSMLFKSDTPHRTICEEIVAVVRGEHSPGRDLIGAAYAVACKRIRLSPAAMEVLRGAAEGKRAQAIALELGCAENTVNRRLKTIRAKLGVTTIAGAVARAYEIGLLSR